MIKTSFCRCAKASVECLATNKSINMMEIRSRTKEISQFNELTEKETLTDSLVRIIVQQHLLGKEN